MEASQAKTYLLPQGWDSRATVATQLDCSEDAAARLMAPLIKSGAVETKVFPVWDKLTKRLQRVTAYHRVTSPAAKSSK
ncbi:MAG: hypothetical protein KGL39_45565 [Patescibacteria group bacterium]|nr:hypothetical protein [Patescibacteria group bacterium]